MSSFKVTTKICFQNFRKWKVNYRVWAVALFAVIFVHYFTNEIGSFANQLNLKVTPWIYPFLYNQKYVKLLFYFPLVLLFCDAPFIDDNQPYMMARSGRKTWSMGQILYIFLSSGMYFMFLILITVLLHVSHMEFTMGWGKVLGTLADTNAAREIGLKIIVSSKIQHYFNPVQAMWFSFFLTWMVGFLLGLIIYVFNCLTNTRIAGVLCASFLLILDATVIGDEKAQWFSPVSWCNLDSIDVGALTGLPTISYIYAMLFTLIVGLIILAFIINRKQSIEVLPPV